MSKARWMVYGANGYTGRLIAEEADRRGLAPVLAGRRPEAVSAIADQYGFEARAFSLDSPGEIARNLEGVDAVLLAAGPFAHTSTPMVDACLSTGTHYLDITGELSVFETCHGRTAEARDAGCVLLPGVGFDVVPTDCMAASLADALPDANDLVLAFRGVGSPSAGTAKTMVEGMPQGGAVRRDGRIQRVPIAWKTMHVPFRDKPRQAVTIPWGDVSTAYHSTGIPNVTVYMAMPPRAIRMSRLSRPLVPILARPTVQRLLKKRIERRVNGPDEHTRRTANAQIWGLATAADGRTVEGTLVTPEAYQLTAQTAVDSAQRVASGDVEPGASTPSRAFGADYITGFAGCDLQIGAVERGKAA